VSSTISGGENNVLTDIYKMETIKHQLKIHGNVWVVAINLTITRQLLTYGGGAVPLWLHCGLAGDEPDWQCYMWQNSLHTTPMNLSGSLQYVSDSSHSNKSQAYSCWFLFLQQQWQWPHICVMTALQQVAGD